MLFDYYDSITGNWLTNPKYKEILKLDRMLTEAHIPHTLNKLMNGYQVCYPTNRDSVECVMDAIEHSGSFGSSDDTLEIMGLLTHEEKEDDSVLGYLTAEEVFDRIRKHWDGEWDEYAKRRAS